MTITAQTLELIAGKSPNAAKFVDGINKAIVKYDLSNSKRLAAFLSQIIVESGNFNHMVENLNYSAEGLTKTFHKYFPSLDSAAPFARNPEKIANKVYASRLGNGDEASGDGWKFRGRGLIQLTGKENYQNLAKAIGKTLDETVEYLKTEEGAVVSAGWFWDSRKLNSIADTGDIVAVSKKVNGGTIGLDERQKYYNKAISVLG